MIGAIVDSSMAGAIQAHRAGENPWAGAMLGVTILGVSSVVGYVVGGWTGYLTYEAGAGYSVASYASTLSRSFAAGATSGGMTATAYGGNVWKEALYGGLTSAAMAGTTSPLSYY